MHTSISQTQSKSKATKQSQVNHKKQQVLTSNKTQGPNKYPKSNNEIANHKP